MEGRESETGGTQHSDEEARLSATTTAGLQALARGHRITLNILLQGVWALFLSRYTSREDVVFGVIVSGRNGPLPGIETVVGLLMNVQPMRARVRRQERLLPWLKELQERQAQAHCHEHVPLTTLQSWLGTGGQGLFDTIFVFENFPVTGSSARRRSSTLEIRRPWGAGAVNYPLALVVEPESELLLRIRHDVYRFDAAVVRSMLRTYESFLEAVLADPGCELGDFLAIAVRPNEVVQSFNEAIDDF